MSDLLRACIPPSYGVADRFHTSTYSNTPSARNPVGTLYLNGLRALATVFMNRPG